VVNISDTIKISIFWNVMPCRLLDVYRHFRGRIW